MSGIGIGITGMFTEKEKVIVMSVCKNVFCLSFVILSHYIIDGACGTYINILYINIILSNTFLDLPVI